MIQKISRTTFVCIIFASILLPQSCKTSSDKENSPEDVSNTDYVFTEGIFPFIDFAVPEVTTNAFQLVQSKTSMLDSWIKRSNTIIDQTNNLMNALNMEVKDKANFSKKGSGGDLSGSFGNVQGDFSEEVLVCSGGTKFFHMKWNKDGSQIRIVRDFSVNPVISELETALMTQIDFSKTGYIRVNITNWGAPWEKPSLIKSETHVAENQVAEEDKDGNISLSGVQDWVGTEVSSFTPDAYLVAKLKIDGTGNFLAFSSFSNPPCTESFDAKSTTPGFCLGGTAGDYKAFNAKERSTAWESLGKVGLVSASGLKKIAIETDLSCP